MYLRMILYAGVLLKMRVFFYDSVYWICFLYSLDLGVQCHLLLCPKANVYFKLLALILR